MARQESSSPVAADPSLDQEDSAPIDLPTSKVSAKGRVEASSLKRGRAESVEPSLPESAPLLSTAKKNRVAPSTGQTPSKPLDVGTSPNNDKSAGINKSAQSDDTEEKDETKNVGEVRRKVEKMTYDEKQEQDKSVELDLPDKTDDQPNSAMSILTTRPASEIGADEKEEEWEKIDKDEAIESKEVESKTEGNGQDGLKRKTLDRSESSYVKGDGEEAQVKRQKDKITPPPNEEKESTAATDDKALKEVVETAPPPKKPSSFASFSSAASPFASKSTASPFASKSGTSAFGAASASTPSKSVFSGSGFGNYSSSFSPFASKKPVADPKEEEGDDEGSKAGPSSFGDILKAGGEATADEEEEEKVQMTEQDVHTGEEEEETLFQTRTKLYVMQADGGWKERGLGVLRLNVRRHDGKGARLVMRADGVLRVILNVSLYVGMSCLEDGKHVRMTVFENGERRLVTFRTGSNKAAAELSSVIHDHIPLESSVPPRSPDPENPEEKV